MLRGTCITLTCFLACQLATAQDASRTGLDEADVRNWTPDIDAAWGNPPWRQFGEAKVVDDRFMATDYGPLYGATVEVKADNGQTLGRAHKGLVIRLGGEDEVPKAAFMYDKNLMLCQAGWIGGWTHHSDSRFGLLDIPWAEGDVRFVMPAEQPWVRTGKPLPERESWCFPMPEAAGRFDAVHLRGHDVVLEYTVHGTSVLEHPTLERIGDNWRLVRHVEVGPDDEQLDLRVADLDGGCFAAITGDAAYELDNDGYLAHVPPRDSPRRFKIVHDVSPDNAPALGDVMDLSAMLAQDPTPRWPDRLTTRREFVGQAGPYVHERIVPPFENPWDSLMFLGGLDVLDNGDPIVSTLFGDVWVVSDADTDAPVWKRFATGLYQPLGIRVVNGEIFVIERGQLTQLIDHDGDGEADEYRNINNRWHTPGDPHCYDINLETDPAGNWFFVKNGGWHTPTGGCILKIAPDGSGDAQVYATGFRHCNALGIDTNGQLASGGQQGTWQPATRWDLNRHGGFYGLVDAAHGDVEIYDRPLFWMPLECDNSAGDPVFAPEGWGPLGGQWLHLSWGQCWLLHVLQEQVDGMPQGGVCVLPLGRTMAGPGRGRFSPHDGNLWIAGCMGWQTWGPWDGTLDCIRYTDAAAPMPTPSALRTLHEGIELTFEQPLDAEVVTDPSNWRVDQWNYHWHGGYGSPHFSTRRWMEEGEDTLAISAVRWNPDTRRATLHLPDLRPAMQTRVGWALTTPEGTPVDGRLWATTHRVPAGGAVSNPGPADIFANATITLRWHGPLEHAELLVRAVDTEAGHPEGIGVPVHVDAQGPHELVVTMLDRRISAVLDGEPVFNHHETDTRVPAAGAVHLLQDGFVDLVEFTVQPLAAPPSGVREPAPVHEATAS